MFKRIKQWVSQPSTSYTEEVEVKPPIVEEPVITQPVKHILELMENDPDRFGITKRDSRDSPANYWPSKSLFLTFDYSLVDTKTKVEFEITGRL